LKLVSIIALRKAKNAGVTSFLNDKDILVVTEAARAINDDGGIIEALPTLANMMTSIDMKYEPLARRILSAALKSGRPQDLTAIYAFANNPATSVTMREEAYSSLATWHNPSAMDRVDGRHLGAVIRDSGEVRKMIVNDLNKLFTEKNPTIIKSIAGMVVGQNITKALPNMLSTFTASKDEEVRSNLLKSMDLLKYPQIADLVKTSLNDPSEKLRTTAIGLIKESNVNPTFLNELSTIVFAKGGKSEQQQLLNLIRDMKKELTIPTVKSIAQKYNAGSLLPEVQLEFFEVLDSLKNQEINAMVTRKKENILDEFKDALHGGNGGAGYGLFNYDSKAECVKCHKIDGYGSNVGPDLSKIGKTLTREQILEAIINPSARLAPGYGTLSAKTKDGRKIVGIVLEDRPNMLLIKTSDAEPLHLKKADISSSEYYPSAMTPYNKKLKKKEIRDLVEYLAGRV
jgi:quinoprotein glucose dehydrogenase